MKCKCGKPLTPKQVKNGTRWCSTWCYQQHTRRHHQWNTRFKPKKNASPPTEGR